MLSPIARNRKKKGLAQYAVLLDGMRYECSPPGPHVPPNERLRRLSLSAIYHGVKKAWLLLLVLAFSSLPTMSTGILLALLLLTYIVTAPISILMPRYLPKLVG